MTPIIAGATTTHFDDLQQTTRVTTYYAPEGLANVTNGAVYVVNPNTMGNAGFPTPFRRWRSDQSGNHDEPVFSSPVSGVSFYYTSTSSTNSVVALDANGLIVNVASLG